MSAEQSKAVVSRFYEELKFLFVHSLTLNEPQQFRVTGSMLILSGNYSFLTPVV